ncbi:hypothetical protein MY3296_007273 [Beauveria thailandica]
MAADADRSPILWSDVGKTTACFDYQAGRVTNMVNSGNLTAATHPNLPRPEAPQ